MSSWTAWIDEVVASLREPEQVRTWVARTADAVCDHVPSADLRPTILRAIEEHWLAYLGQVLVPETAFTLPPAADELAVDLARLRLDARVLLKIYQVAQEASWEFAVDLVREAPREVDHEALLVWLWSKANTWFGRSVEASLASYQAEDTRIRRRGDVRRHELVSDLLAGGSVGPSELSATLGGHPVTATWHLALIARALTADAIERLEPTLADLARQVRGARLTLVRPGGRELWGWLTTDGTRPALDGAGIDSATVRVTLGGPLPELDGFVAAHQDARTAQRVALAPGRAAAVTAYDDVAALTLLALDPPAAERFVRATLRGLADPDVAHLRTTVRTVLTSSESADAVARTLGVHKNTVRYRVTQAERLLGRPLPHDAGNVLLAIDYHAAFLA